MASSKPRTSNVSHPTWLHPTIESHRLALRCRILHRLDSSLAHDWKGRLNRAVLDLELARADLDGGDASQVEARIASAIEQMRELGASIQVLHERAPRAADAREITDLRNALARIDQAFAPGLSRTSISLDVESGDEGPVVKGEPEVIELMVAGLVQNAIDAMTACGKRGRITVRAAARGDEAIVTVADMGPGIDANAVQRLRELASSTSPFHGVGFPFVAHVCQRLSGRFEISNREEGGVRATVILPRFAEPSE